MRRSLGREPERCVAHAQSACDRGQTLELFLPNIEDYGRQGIGKPKGDELHSSDFIQVRQVTARVPAEMAIAGSAVIPGGPCEPLAG